MLAELSIGTSFEALLSLEKKTTPSWSAVPFLRLVAQKRYPSKLCHFQCFSYHIGETCLVKEFSWSRCFFGTDKPKSCERVVHEMLLKLEATLRRSRSYSMTFWKHESQKLVSLLHRVFSNIMDSQFSSLGSRDESGPSQQRSSKRTGSAR